MSDEKKPDAKPSSAKPKTTKNADGVTVLSERDYGNGHVVRVLADAKRVWKEQIGGPDE